MISRGPGRRKFLGRRTGPWLGVSPISWGAGATAGSGQPVTAERVLAEARRLSVDGVEAGPDGFFLRPPLGLPRLRVVGGLVSTYVDRTALASVDAHARRLRRLGARIMVLSAIAEPAPAAPALEAQAWARFFDAVAGLEAICRQHGLELAFHPEHDSRVQSQVELERFLVGCEVGICLDTGDLALGGMDAAEIVELAPRRIRHVHLKDLDPALLEEVRGGRLSHADAVARGLYLPLGEGEPRALRALEAVLRHGFEGWIVIEQPRRAGAASSEQVLADIRQSTEAVRRLL